MFAQEYPTKPVRIIEPFGVSGGPDLIARTVSPKLSEVRGQPVTVESHPGAGSTDAPAPVAKSPADGYTLLVNTSAQAYSAAFVKNLPHDRLKDFIPVAPLTSQLCLPKTSSLPSSHRIRSAVAVRRSPPDVIVGCTEPGLRRIGR
jgi:tripartite-type tricarboxylate transporter receptor subunit TctC